MLVATLQRRALPATSFQLAMMELVLSAGLVHRQILSGLSAFRVRLVGQARKGFVSSARQECTLGKTSMRA